MKAANSGLYLNMTWDRSGSLTVNLKMRNKVISQEFRRTAGILWVVLPTAISVEQASSRSS